MEVAVEGIMGERRGAFFFFAKDGTVRGHAGMRTGGCLNQVNIYILYVVKGPGWCKVRPAAGGRNMMHVSLWLKVLRGQATTPQGMKKKKKKGSQVSVAAQEAERDRGNRMWRKK